ncbi:MAG TPA: hypothetical protein VLK36_01090 [Gaiellaceae bacterium]|nr:hypothetical protein [Gaiellaceae bacterium]
MNDLRPAGVEGARTAAGDRVAGFTYGTLVALSMVIAGAKLYPDEPGRVAAFVVLTTVALWLAHVYAHTIGQSVSHERRLQLAELRHIARREGAIVEAVLPPVVPLLLAAAGLLSIQVALWAAFGLGLVVLAVQGVQFARVERFGTLRTAIAVAVNVGVGLILVAAKVVLTH